MHSCQTRVIVSCFTLAVAACAGTATSQSADLGDPPGPHSTEFSDYWYRGAAELTSYTLEQARYGEVHDGHAVLIFVTEDFSREKQVKLDRPDAAGGDRVKIMKLNLTKKFNTGIYPYSMMSSVFTPVDVAKDSKTLKVTTTSQEWCGHTFEQLNRTDDGYRVELKSYFESEGDRNLEIDDALPEDGIWTLIRIDPSALPTGKVRLVPGTMFQRLRHTDLEPHTAIAELEADTEDPTLVVYSLEYPDSDRTLAIRFKKAFPHEIESWEESYKSGFGADAQTLTTRAVAQKRKILDYWRRNSVADSALRAELGLE